MAALDLLLDEARELAEGRLRGVAGARGFDLHVGEEVEEVFDRRRVADVALLAEREERKLVRFVRRAIAAVVGGPRLIPERAVAARAQDLVGDDQRVTLRGQG